MDYCIPLESSPIGYYLSILCISVATKDTVLSSCVNYFNFAVFVSDFGRAEVVYAQNRVLGLSGYEVKCQHVGD